MIDHGKLVAQGTPREGIKDQTGAETRWEDAFLKLDRFDHDPRRERQGRPSKCARSRKCGGDRWNAIYMSLAARAEAIYPFASDRFVASLGQPLLYLLALGFGLGAGLSKGGTAAPICNSSRRALSAWRCCFRPSFRASHCCGIGNSAFLKETLVAPVPRLEIMIGRTLGSATTMR